MIISSRHVAATSDVVFAELDGESVLLNVESGTYFGLDAVGTHIWHLLEKGASEEAIFEKLLQEYEVEADQLRRDLEDFLRVLEKNGLLRIVET